MRAARPSGRARCGAGAGYLAINYQSLCDEQEEVSSGKRKLLELQSDFESLNETVIDLEDSLSDLDANSTVLLSANSRFTLLLLLYYSQAYS